MTALTDHVLYTARTRTTGGRAGQSQSPDGGLDIRLSPPGSSGAGTNPEQLLAAGWSACFIGAMGRVAPKLDVKLPADPTVDAEVDLCNSDGEFFLQARLRVHVPGLEVSTAQAVADAAHQMCPYSKATRGNIAVTITAV
jgi:lipoyl-dependent peroxiredoxin